MNVTKHSNGENTIYLFTSGKYSDFKVEAVCIGPSWLDPETLQTEWEKAEICLDPDDFWLKDMKPKRRAKHDQDVEEFLNKYRLIRFDYEAVHRDDRFYYDNYEDDQ